MDELEVRGQGGELKLGSNDPYMEALTTWLQEKPDNTRKSYKRSPEDFFEFTTKRPDKIKSVDVAKWKERLKLNGPDSTVAQRLSAVSSYFSYLQKPQADGRPFDQRVVGPE